MRDIGSGSGETKPARRQYTDHMHNQHDSAVDLDFVIAFDVHGEVLEVRIDRVFIDGDVVEGIKR